MRKINQYQWHYAVLFIGLGLGLFLYFSLPLFKAEAVICLCGFYFSWGVIHHWLAKDLRLKIVIEYLLVALTGCLILLSVILRRGLFF